MISLKNLHSEEGGKCYYCNCQTVIPKYRGKGAKKTIIKAPNNASREHLIPKDHGGLDTRINIKLACSQCNSLRGTMNAVTWKIIAISPSARRGYIKMKQNLKFIKNREHKEASKQRRALETIEKTAGIIVRHHSFAMVYFKEVFGEQRV